jgi:ankyrin repeat protein
VSPFARDKEPCTLLQIGRTALHTAVENWSNRAIVSTLIKAGADIHAADMDGTTPMCCAALADNVSALKTLQKHGAVFLTPHGWNALHAAAVRGSLKAMTYLLMHNKDAVLSINALDDLQDSALSLATKCGHDKVVTLLLQSGAVVNERLLQQREHWHPRAARIIGAHMRKAKTSQSHSTLYLDWTARFL